MPPRGRDPTAAETAFLKGHFPRLADYSVTSVADLGYNCIGWAQNPAFPVKIWPPRFYPGQDPSALFDRFFSDLGLKRTGDRPTLEFAGTVVALYATAAGPQHAARRDAGFPGWWESKLGDYVRVMHKLEELEGGTYGDVVAFYTRRDP